MKNLFTIICFLSFFCINSYSQEVQKKIDYQTYIDLVLKQNIGYAAEKLNVGIAEAELKAARVFNDVTLGVEYADNDDKNMLMGRSVSAELSKTFSSGKRSANIDLAKSEKELTDVLLEDYFHALRAEATLAYLEAVMQTELFRVKQQSCVNICDLAKGDSIRHRLGKITKVDAIKSGLEAGISRNEVIQMRAELHNTYSSLDLWIGDFSDRTLLIPEGTLAIPERIFDTEELLQTALANRADLAAAMKNADVARKALIVSKRERNMDFDLALGYNYNTEVRNDIAPAPQFNGITLGVAIPLKFSNINKGSVLAAGQRAQQAELNYRQAELEVQTSVIQSLRQYKSMLEQVKNFENSLLQDAKSVIDGKIYSYERGETSLLEVLDAQRTYDDLQATYIETLYHCAAALVELERNAGIWDIK